MHLPGSCLIAACAGLLIFGQATAGAAGPPPRPPNIILVMPGGLGCGDLACLGNPLAQTPNLNRFHAECVRFTNFHASPTSSASRAALLTGRHEFRGGVTHTMLQRERLR